MDIRKIGVIGAGQMGNGIAHVMALAGYEVLLTDISQEALDRGIETITGNMDRQSAAARSAPRIATPPWRESRPRSPSPISAPPIW